MVNPLYLIYRTGLAPTNGTSIYLSRLLEGVGDSVVHLMWDSSEGGVQSVKQVVVVEDRQARWPFPFLRGRGVYMSCRDRMGLTWWNRGHLNLAMLQRKLRAFRSRPQQAWIICMMESDASCALGIWEGLGKPPFLLHVLDIFHDRLSEEETPRFRRLIREARHVLCISENIAAEMRSNGAQSVSLLPFCSDFSNEGRQSWAPPLQIIMSGTVWGETYVSNPACELLVEAWPEIKREFPGIELHYSGPSAKHMPTELLAEIQDHGFLKHDAYEDLLRSCHLAYLPVSHSSTTVGRFSLPSRLGDYLACGLPIIASTDEGTAIAAFVRALPVGCAVNVNDAGAFLTAVKTFAGNAESWAKASATATAFARNNLRVTAVRDELSRQLVLPPQSASDNIAQP